MFGLAGLEHLAIRVRTTVCSKPDMADHPMLLVTWLTGFARTPLLTVSLSVATLSVGSSFLLVRKVVTNEAGIPFPVTGYRIGYWLWLSSMATAFVWACLRSLRAAVAHTPTFDGSSR
jgi:hypothetical protein